MTRLLIHMAIFGHICTWGFLYSVGRLPYRATDRAASKNPKVQKKTEMTVLCHLYLSEFYYLVLDNYKEFTGSILFSDFLRKQMHEIMLWNVVWTFLFCCLDQSSTASHTSTLNVFGPRWAPMWRSLSLFSLGWMNMNESITTSRPSEVAHGGAKRPKKLCQNWKRLKRGYYKMEPIQYFNFVTHSQHLLYYLLLFALGFGGILC